MVIMLTKGQYMRREYSIFYQTYVWGCCLHFSTVWMTHYYYKSIPMSYVLYCEIFPLPSPSPSFRGDLALVPSAWCGWAYRTGRVVKTA